MEEHNDNADNKKKLINETITGRRFTPGRFIRHAVTAVLCGIIFGISAALVFMAVQRRAALVPDLAEPASADIAGSIPDGTASGTGTPEQPDAEIPAQAESEHSAGDSAAAGSSENDEDVPHDSDETAEVPQETAAADEQAGTDVPVPDGTDSGTDKADSDTDSDNDEISEADADRAVFDSIISARSAAVSGIGDYIVSVSAISTATTWFESEALSSTEYAGLIIDVGEDEVLILTCAAAADSESLRVTFSNRVSVDAYVKQYSSHDNLAVLAVSAVNGMEENMLADMESVIFAEENDIYAGEPVIAAGAPYGRVWSYAFGDIGYIDGAYPCYDREDSIIYADIMSDNDSMTFIMGYDLKLLGVALKSGSDNIPGNTSSFVSASSLKSLIEGLKAGESIAYIGVEGTKVTFDMYYSGMPEGVYITDIEAGSPAYSAGLMRGDIIVSINETDILDMKGFSDELDRFSAGDVLTIKGLRVGPDGEYSELEFTVNTAER